MSSVTADRAEEAGQLMPGEDPSSRVGADADHWALVYGELLAFNRKLIAAMEQVGLAPPNGSPEEPDLKLLRANIRRMEARLTYWVARQAELAR
jgi:hypothetical protein